MLAQYVTEFHLFYFDKISTFMSVCFVIFILVFVFFGEGLVLLFLGCIFYYE